jgi:16S rRNA (guanine966-N2)-methyltransferase
VLDLFAGTGALGIEAVSRGAGFTLFVDNGAEARALVAQQCRGAGLGLQGDKGLSSRRHQSRPGASDGTILAGLSRSALWQGPCGEGAGLAARWRLATAGALLVVEEAKAAAFAAPDGFRAEELERRV